MSPLALIWPGLQRTSVMPGHAVQLRQSISPASKTAIHANCRAACASGSASRAGGRRRGGGLARALVLEPEVLLLGEPFGALDAQTRLVLQEQLARLVETNGTTPIPRNAALSGERLSA